MRIKVHVKARAARTIPQVNHLHDLISARTILERFGKKSEN